MKKSSPFCREASWPVWFTTQLILCWQLSLCAARPATVEHLKTSNLTPPIQAASRLPEWAVPFGNEFWRAKSPAKPSPTAASGTAPREQTQFDAAEIIDRVSHAFAVQNQNKTASISEPNYAATLDGDELSLRVARETGTISTERERNGVHTVFRTVSISRQDANLYEPNPGGSPRVIVGNTAQLLLNHEYGLIQHFEARSEGVSVTWVVSKAVPGAGPLVVAIKVGSLEYAGRTAEGDHFADPGGLARLRFGNAWAVDRTGRQWPLKTRAAEGRLCIEVPEEILATAMYPLAIDPLISPEFGMDKPVFDASADSQTLPAVASNGSEFLLVWADQRIKSNEILAPAIYGTRLNLNGEILDPDGFPITTEGVLHSPNVASNGRDFLVVWEYQPVLLSQIHGARVTAEGKVLDESAIKIGDARGYYERAPTVASDGKDYFVAWSDGRFDQFGDILGARVSATGRVEDPEPIRICDVRGVQTAPKIASIGGDYLAVWIDGRTGGYELFRARVSASGTVSDANRLFLGSVVTSSSVPAVASNGLAYFIIWPDARGDIYGCRLDDQAKMLGGSMALSTATGIESNVALANAGTNFFCVWLDSRANGTLAVRGLLVNGDGSIPDRNGLDLNETGSRVNKPVVAAAGADILAAWIDTRENFGYAPPGHVLATVLTNQQVKSKPSQVLYRLPNAQLTPGVAFNGTNYLVVWEDRRIAFLSDIPLPASRIYGMRVDASGRVLDTASLALATNGTRSEFAPAVASNGRDYLVAWVNLDSRGAGDIQVARISPEGAELPAGALRLGPGSSPAIASNGSDYLVVWTATNEVRAARIGSATDSMATNFLIFRTVAPANPRVASDGKDYLVVWANSVNSGGSYFAEVLAMRVNSDGVFVRSEPIRVMRKDGFGPLNFHPPGSGDLTLNGDHLFPDVASTGDGYLITWQQPSGYRNVQGVFVWDFQIYATFLAPTANLTNSPSVAIGSPSITQGKARVAANKNGYLVVWQDTREFGKNGIDIYGRHVSPSGVPSEDGDFLINANSRHQLVPSVVAGKHNRLLVVSEGYRDGTRRVVGNLVSPNPITARNGDVILLWPSEPGTKYRVQFTPDIVRPVWTDFPGEVLATGDTATKLDQPAANTSQRYYRVIELR